MVASRTSGPPRSHRPPRRGRPGQEHPLPRREARLRRGRRARHARARHARQQLQAHREQTRLQQRRAVCHQSLPPPQQHLLKGLHERKLQNRHQQLSRAHGQPSLLHRTQQQAWPYRPRAARTVWWSRSDAGGRPRTSPARKPGRLVPNGPQSNPTSAAQGPRDGPHAGTPSRSLQRRSAGAAPASSQARPARHRDGLRTRKTRRLGAALVALCAGRPARAQARRWRRHQSHRPPSANGKRRSLHPRPPSARGLARSTTPPAARTRSSPALRARAASARSPSLAASAKPRFPTGLSTAGTSAPPICLARPVRKIKNKNEKKKRRRKKKKKKKKRERERRV